MKLTVSGYQIDVTWGSIVAMAMAPDRLIIGYKLEN
jgi:hypothetical protein